MSTTVNYKGNTIATLENETKKLTTKGTWLEDDIEIVDTGGSGGGTALIVDTTDSHGGIIREITTDTEVRLQGRKTVTPTSQTQIITADTGYDGIVEVEVAPGTGGVPNVYQDENGVLILDSESTEVGEWKRPLNWMPYANGWEEEESVYYVYDLALNDVEDIPGFYSVIARNAYVAQIGYISEQGIFTAETTTNMSDQSRTEGWLPYWDGENINERFFVIKITPQSGKTIYNTSIATPSQDFFRTKYDLATPPSATSQMQPCIEVYGHVPNLIGFNLQNRYLKHCYFTNACPTSLSYSLNSCGNLECIDGLDTWDTSNCTIMSQFLRDCVNLKYINGIETFDVSKVTNLTYAFSGLYSLEELDLSDWNISTALTNISYAFRDSRSLKKINLSGWNVTGVTTINDVFRETYRPAEIKLTGWNLASSSFSYSFYGLQYLESLDMSIFNFDNTNNLNKFLYQCRTIREVDFRGKDTSNVITMDCFCSDMTSLRKANMTGCDFSSITNTSTNIFSNCPSLVELKGFAYTKSFNISASTLIPATNLVEILTSLPSVETTQTITLGNTNKNKLTAEQIAIATEKGWTVA